MKKVLFVCHGNICRSTMAESVFTYIVKQRGIEKDFEINSAATSTEEIGNGVHYGTVKKLKELNIPVVPHKAIQIKKEDEKYYDYILAMDDNNIRNIEKIFGKKSDKVKKLLYFTDNDDNILDPWYTGNFDDTYKDILRGIEAFLKKIY